MKKKRQPAWLRASIVLALSALAVGCATTKPMQAGVANAVRQAVAEVKDANRSRSTVKTVEDSYVRAVPIDYAPVPHGSVSLKVSRAGMHGVLQGIAASAGYTVTLESGIEAGKPVSIELRNMEPEEAMKDVAFAAGFAAVIDKAKHSVTVAEKAAYTYRLPPHLLQHLITQYSVSSVPGSSAGGAGSGSPGGMQLSGLGGGASGVGAVGSAAGSAVSASFSVHAQQEHDLDSFKRFISSLAGGDASVNVMAESGLVSVRASAQQLRRVSGFLENYIKDATAQVELQVSIIEVSLTDEFQFGIDWSKVIGLKGLLGSGANASVQIRNGDVVAAPSLTTTITTQSTSTVIKALEKFTKVRIISQPRLYALNHSPAIIHDGTQIPYLPSVSTTVTGTSGTTTNSGALSFAMDGVSLSFKPNILDNSHVEISVVPVLSSVAQFQTFNLGGGAQLTAPRQPVTQSHMQVVAESGKTLIVGGTKTANDNGVTSGLPGTRDVPFFGRLVNGYNDNATRKELVLLVHANIIPARQYNFLIGESL